ncbi:chemokine-like receptor 1 isoform X2 [Sceloporus undulatus]|uniref:chemokine-like receptor 1 isoform X2 n=1 Tax=Sceloporus undulatus TaxID=8520 RepID=UPI001C4B8CE6|nr:chemokine-like receptor 1 isoform X2 [Sceloporus undulatus]XP_042297353.1 chemokine-like receptor 1 isoform X2 [Sceloporus undulatus]XP_042297354.1 chemokine-like receptor 1 isoform X2 [Sceloporus undulatus]XP_042297355.1 chemokine-like receptor 1 isoform X2 [Sceloporus undulatus]
MLSSLSIGLNNDSLIWLIEAVMEVADNYSDDYFDYYDWNHSFTTEEAHREESARDFKSTVQILAVLIYSITCLLGLVGNGLVIAMIMFKMKKSVSIIWFLNLAAADFLFNVFLPLNIAYTAMNYHWVFGRGMCKVNSLLLNLNLYTSVFLLTTISFDRCMLVVCPVWSQNHRNAKSAWLLCALIWTLGFFMSSPSLVFRDTATVQGSVICFNNFSLSRSPFDHSLGELRHTTVTIARFLVGFIVPLTVITVCYIIIIVRLKRNRLAKSKKPMRIIIAIIVTFFLCWCPYHVFYLLETQHHAVPRSVLEFGVPIVTAIAVSNSCMNPVLYVFLGQDFKKFKMTVLSRLANALSEDTVHSTLPRRSFTKPWSMTEKETILS